MLKKLQAANFINEEEALSDKLLIADVAEAMSVDNVKGLPMAEYTVLATKLKTNGVVIPDTAAVQMLRRVAQGLLEDHTRQAVLNLVRVLKLKLSIDEAAHSWLVVTEGTSLRARHGSPWALLLHNHP